MLPTLFIIAWRSTFLLGGDFVDTVAFVGGLGDLKTKLVAGFGFGDLGMVNLHRIDGLGKTSPFFANKNSIADFNLAVGNSQNSDTDLTKVVSYLTDKNVCHWFMIA